jgi:hypothetical protein
MSRNSVIDLLKLVLALMVVGIHADLFIETSKSVNHILADGIFRLAAPIFFVINGYYLSSCLKESNSFFIWAKKIMFLYCFWMFVYSPFYFHLIKSNNTLVFFAKAVFMFLIGYHHLWYVAALICAGFLLFFLRNVKHHILITLAIILFSLGSFIQYIAYYQYNITLPYLFYRNFLFFAFPLLTIGHLIRREYFSNLESSSFIKKILLGGMIIFAIEVLFSYLFRSKEIGFDIYLSLIIICPLIFLMIKKCRFFVGIASLSKISSEIYFIHPLLISACLNILHMPIGSWLFFMAIALCFMIYKPIIWLNQKISCIL